MKIIKEKYVKLNIIQKQKYIKIVKNFFEKVLAKKLDLIRVSAPLFVTTKSGLQDGLSGVERSVAFDVKKDGEVLEIVQSLAKWKRYALGKYKIDEQKGLYTDMTAIRRDDKIDETHSIYVDQWDWEKRISKKDRTMDYLKATVQKIVQAICATSKMLKRAGFDGMELSPRVHFISSQKLLEMYPDCDAKQREYLVTKKYKTVFITQIGNKLSDGQPHDLRAPDYDDWSLNGDLLFYHEVLDMALEVSSMGIRVDKNSLLYQLQKSHQMDKIKLDYHQSIIQQKLPLSIGGGIGQSRLCQLLLGRAHIGEVQAGYWDKATLDLCQKHHIELL